jgi:polyketide cyclase/dehydrase/lipid transport protein
VQVVEAHAHSAADRAAVWRVVADAEGWSRWGDWERAELQRTGEPPPAGLGAVKALKRGRVTSVEEVTAFEPPGRFGYRLLSGLPLRGYEAAITLADAPGGGTDIAWRSQFEPKIPLTGGLFRRGLQRFMQDAAERLAREAERP